MWTVIFFFLLQAWLETRKVTKESVVAVLIQTFTTQCLSSIGLECQSISANRIRLDHLKMACRTCAVFVIAKQRARFLAEPNICQHIRFKSKKCFPSWQGTKRSPFNKRTFVLRSQISALSQAPRCSEIIFCFQSPGLPHFQCFINSFYRLSIFT